ncbi:MAG: DUF3667 domain-containing protein [Verrucomicrobiota bacterium]|nr:DUF3667 domain-containing protein [Chthoniobacterales bacterium]MDQ3414379.1 DUF3667 domain-containing protein [Verrucomicrobiota bacterium]
MGDETTPLILGDAATAELHGHPGRKWLRRKRKARPPLSHCENCGTALTGPYCTQCGQAGVDYHRSFGSLLADAADAFFNFDARFFRSFALLLFKPWRLTNDFVEGKRARHVHPLRVYLIASVLFFLVINFLAKEARFQTGQQSDRTELSLASPSFTSEPVPPGAPTPAFSLGTSSPPRARFSLGWEEDATLEQNKSPSSFGGWVERRVKEKVGPTGDRGDLFLKTLIQNLAPMVLCCIPLFALVLKILYVFKRRFYIEHLIFALHTHAFIFLSTVLIIGIGFLLAMKNTALTAITCTFLGTAVLIQLLVAIRRVYRQNWWATLFKFFLGSVIYVALLSLAFGVTAFLTLLLP